MKIVRIELEELMGAANEDLDLHAHLRHSTNPNDRFPAPQGNTNTLILLSFLPLS